MLRALDQLLYIKYASNTRERVTLEKWEIIKDLYADRRHWLSAETNFKWMMTKLKQTGVFEWFAPSTNVCAGCLHIMLASYNVYTTYLCVC